MVGLEQQRSRTQRLIRDEFDIFPRTAAFQDRPDKIPVRRVGPDPAEVARLDAVQGRRYQSLHGLGVHRELTVKNAARDRNGKLDQLFLPLFSSNVLQPGECGHNFFESISNWLDLRLVLPLSFRPPLPKTPLPGLAGQPFQCLFGLRIGLLLRQGVHGFSRAVTT